jgi:Spx/MgsR family transcriptional regulator
MTTIYGIKNCDTMKKAIRWLNDHNVDYQFHDYRKDGLTKKQLQTWATELGWENLLNRRGTTWRKLPEEIRESINKSTAISLMLENPAIIKRPLLVTTKQKTLGFDPATYQSLFS